MRNLKRYCRKTRGGQKIAPFLLWVKGLLKTDLKITRWELSIPPLARLATVAHSFWVRKGEGKICPPPRRAQTSLGYERQLFFFKKGIKDFEQCYNLHRVSLLKRTGWSICSSKKKTGSKAGVRQCDSRSNGERGEPIMQSSKAYWRTEHNEAISYHSILLTRVRSEHYGLKWRYGWPAVYAKICFTHNVSMRGPIAMKLCISIVVSFAHHSVTHKWRGTVTSRICDVIITSMSQGRLGLSQFDRYHEVF